MTPEPPPNTYRPPEPPASAPPPAAYDPSFYGPLGPIREPVRVRVLKLVVVLGLLGAGLVGMYWVARAKGWLVPVAQYRGSPDGDGQAGIKSSIRYPVEPQAQRAVANGGDPDADWKRGVNRRLAEHDAKLGDHESRIKNLEELMKGKKPPPVAAAPAKEPPKPKPYRSMQFVSNKVEEKKGDEPGTYLLAPGATKLACTVETMMNSDVADSYFTAKLRNDIYDTATGSHLLAPQGSTILGRYHSQQLLFGNERLPTTSLTLALPNGKSVDIGNAPVMDGKGQAGLVSSVNQHWARLFSSVIIMGVLRGGQQTIQTQITATDPSGAVASGIAGAANQVGQMRIGPALNTKPTIVVDPGEPCNVLLIKPLSLPDYRAS